MKLKLKRGTTSKKLRVYIQDSSSTTGAGLTGLTSGSSGLTWYYSREGDTSTTAVTLVAGTLGTYSSGGFVAVDGTNMPGVYEIGVPNAALASGAAVHMILKGATNMVPRPIEIELDAVDYQDATKLGLNALPNATSGAANGLPVLTSGGILNTNPTTILGDADSLTGLQAAGTEYFGNSGFVVSSLSNNARTNVAEAVWDTLTSVARTAGSYGAKLKAWVLGSDNKAMISADAGAIPTGAITAASIAAAALNGKGDWLLASGYTAPDNADIVTALSDLVTLLARTDPTTAIAAIQTTATAIKAKTDNLPTSPAAVSDVPTASTIATQVNTTLTASHGTGSWQTGAGGGGGSGLSGPSSVTLTFHDASNAAVPLVQFTVQGQGAGRANSSGVATFGLPDGTYTVTAQITAGVVFADTTLTVSGTTAQTITGSNLSLPSPNSPSQQAASIYCYSQAGAVQSGQVIEYRVLTTGTTGGRAIAGRWAQSAASDVNGLVTLQLIVGETYELRRDGGTPVVYTPASTGSVLLTIELLGRAS
jgi:hypothetical protein